MLRPAEVQRVSGFVAVTARTGQEWLDQCEKPGQKSDSTVRFAACMSFMKGAQLVAAPSDPTTICAQKVAAQPAGAMLDTTFAAARQYPNRPLKTVFGIAFTSLEPSECKSGR